MARSRELEMVVFEPVHRFLERSPAPDEEWLWCIFCERFFQAGHLRLDYLGNRQGCAFCECAGFDCAIFRWDTFREGDKARWPATVAELHHGLRLGSNEGGTGRRD